MLPPELGLSVVWIESDKCSERDGLSTRRDLLNSDTRTPRGRGHTARAISDLDGGLLLLLSVSTIFPLERAAMSDKNPFESESPTLVRRIRAAIADEQTI